MKVGFVDFQDSFSFNIVQELKQLGLDVIIFEFPHFEEAFHLDLVVLGPGPGHPDEYQKIIPFIQKRLTNKEKVFGVCLGHQLIWRSLGYEVIKSKLPLHGQKIQINLSYEFQKALKLSEQIEVQRYNSLIVDLSKGIPDDVVVQISQDELQLSFGINWLSYQFHPESVGTSFRSSFFTPLLSFPL